MSKPLRANPQRISEASKWHYEVFAMFAGPKKICALCKTPGATDAAHVIGRAHLGPLRYIDPRLGRPSHRSCHEAVDQYKIQWPLEIRQDAARAANQYAKVPYHIPEE